LAQTPNPQSPIPNPQSPLYVIKNIIKINKIIAKVNYQKKFNYLIIFYVKINNKFLIKVYSIYINLRNYLGTTASEEATPIVLLFAIFFR
jgi:hypothetical protein